ncbi:MAG: ribbon-helix-helix domain-containing protein [Bacteroidales bacterium]|nr:ribbon-helix-helix domain-containing protein [Bacteroidales bacterium]
MAKPTPNRKQRTPRRHKVSFLLNDKELQVLDKYCKRYNIQNRSRIIREALMKTILRRYENDSPTLFD